MHSCRNTILDVFKDPDVFIISKKDTSIDKGFRTCFMLLTTLMLSTSFPRLKLLFISVSLTTEIYLFVSAKLKQRKICCKWVSNLG